MGGTNNLFDRNGHKFMHPIQVRDEMRELLVFYLECGYNVALMGLISREGEYETISHLNRLYRQLAKDLNIKFFRTKKFRHRVHISSDGLHPSPNGVRELAKDFYESLKKFQSLLYFSIFFFTPYYPIIFYVIYLPYFSLS